MNQKMIVGAALLVLSGASVSAALDHNSFSQVIWTADLSNASLWNVNKSTGINANDAGGVATFNYNYSAIGIPMAPNGSDTMGLKLQANRSGGVFSGLSVSPIGQSFTGNYQLRFDLWLSFQGSAGNGILDGGNGTTQAGGGGIGTAGTTAQWAGGAQDSVHFSATGDGGSAQDYRAYSSAAGSGYSDTSGVFAAGNVAGVRNDTQAYYQGIGGKSAPGAQTTLYPSTQHGQTRPGAAGFAWRDIQITKIDNAITWHLDGLLIATVDASSVTLGGGNILLNYFDTNAGSSTDGALADALLGGLFDNVRVAIVPEPTLLSLAIVGGLALLVSRRRE
jgi:hypothetical protein